jgi:hypothetical protein
MNPQYATVAERAYHLCEYCHAPEAIFNFPFEVEHIIPPRYGGTHDEANLALACRACNLFKSDQVEAEDLETHTVVRLLDPRTDNWQDHLRIELGTGSIIGITPVGRATVNQLNMNTPTQQAARLHWMRLGLFP